MNIETLYTVYKSKKDILQDFKNELINEFKGGDRVKVKNVNGCKFLHTVNYKDLGNWSVREMFGELSDVESALIDKIIYMENCGHASVVEIVDMLRRIATRGMKGVFAKRGDLITMTILREEKPDNVNAAEYWKDVCVGHFHHNFISYKLSEYDVKCIERVLKHHNLL